MTEAAATRIAFFCLVFAVHLGGCTPKVKGKPFKLDEVTVIDVQQLTAEQEQQVGYFLDAVWQDRGYLLDPDHPVTMAVGRVGQRLAEVSDRSDIKYRFKIISDRDTKNAYGVPGGFVYATMGMIELCESEEELAAVVAHELGHIAARHGIKTRQETQQYIRVHNVTVGFIAVIASIAASGVGGPFAPLAARASGRFAAEISGALAKVAILLLLRQHSREHELEADRLGLKYLERAGYPGTALYSLIKKAERENKIQEGSVFATHPPTAERLKAIHQYLTTRARP